MSIATEIVSMKTSQEVTKDSFISIVDSLEKDYHSKQQGFIDTELLYNEENREWTMIQHWASMEELKDVYKRQIMECERVLENWKGKRAA